jgi:nucleoid-associated protein YgaU
MADVASGASKTFESGFKSVPPMVWVAVVGGAAAYYLYKKKQATTAAATTSTQPTVLTYTGVGGQDSTATTTASSGSAPTTNAEWATDAKNYILAAYPQYNAIDVSNAIDAYVGGAQLTSQQNAIVSQAIQGIGAPPETLPPTTGGTTPTQYSWENPEPQTATYETSQYGVTSGTWYTVQQGDTLSSIAQKAYGAASNDYASIAQGATEIYNSNAFQIPDMKNLTPGTKLYIPIILSSMFVNQGSLIPEGGSSTPGQPLTTPPTDWEYTTGQIPTTAAWQGSTNQLQQARAQGKVPV